MSLGLRLVGQMSNSSGGGLLEVERFDAACASCEILQATCIKGSETLHHDIDEEWIVIRFLFISQSTLQRWNTPAE